MSSFFLSTGGAPCKVLPLELAEGSVENARVKVNQPVNDFVYKWVKKSLNHHVVINHHTSVSELSMLCEIIGVNPEII